MKIKSIQISNIQSFKYYEDISDAPKLKLDDDLNILIGQNGSGKSTILEVINFVFKRVFFVQINSNIESIKQREKINEQSKKTFFQVLDNKTHSDFRLKPNWNSESLPQKIQIQIQLDAIDNKNISTILSNIDKINKLIGIYSQNDIINQNNSIEGLYDVEISLNQENRFSVSTHKYDNDVGFNYLVKYNFLKEIINIHNGDYPNDLIPVLNESFSLLGGYRNYSAFNPSTNLRDNSATLQINQIYQSEYIKSATQIENAEPAIFNLVKLRLAEKHFTKFELDGKEAADISIKNEVFFNSINEKLALINLKLNFELNDTRTWLYSYTLVNTKIDKIITDINSLSAGQKAIIHLIFESYGKGDLNGGLVIIDEPEIHLHYQFQNEYLQIIKKLNKQQNCQYILVTHSESLINSETIANVRRFALDEDNYTEIMSPQIHSDQRTLTKILDNTRSAYAFFAKKIFLTEGDTDRYFFKSAFEVLNPNLAQEIAFLDIVGKGNYEKWKNFFESFGLQVYYVCDFDNVDSLKFNDGTIINKSERDFIEDTLKQKKLDNLTLEQQRLFEDKYNSLILDQDFISAPKRSSWKPLIDTYINLVKINNKDKVSKIIETHQDIFTKIEEKYSEKVFILKHGSIEDYIHTEHGNLSDVISFCQDKLSDWLTQDELETVKEVKFILSQLTL